MSANGQLPASELSPITGGVKGSDPGEGCLTHEAAAAWNAMAVKIHEERGVWIGVSGSVSAYRPLAVQWYFWNLYRSGQGNLAAYPGTSNHGWALAGDVPLFVRSLIDTYGAAFGWSKAWSDAPSEWWHLRYTSGHWAGHDPGPYGTGGGGPVDRYPSLHKGDKGGAVKRAQKHLHRWNVGITRPIPDGDFGAKTEKAVREFQITHDLSVDGKIGPRTWAQLRDIDYWLADERGHLNKLRLIRHRGGKGGKRARELRAWLLRRAASIKKTSATDGWNHRHRRQRYKALRRAAAGPKHDNHG